MSVTDNDVQTERLEPVAGNDGVSKAAAVEQLMRDFNDSLIRILKVRLGSYHDAQEVAQEAYVRLLNLDDSRVLSYQRALLFKIAKNLATDRLRRRAYMEIPDSEYLDGRPDPGMDPERSTRALEVIEALPGVLSELPEKCAEAFRLVRIEQYSFDEAALRLGLTKRMVRIHVTRALVFCQERFDEIREAKEGR